MQPEPLSLPSSNILSYAFYGIVILTLAKQKRKVVAYSVVTYVISLSCNFLLFSVVKVDRKLVRVAYNLAS